MCYDDDDNDYYDFKENDAVTLDKNEVRKVIIDSLEKQEKKTI